MRYYEDLGACLGRKAGKNLIVRRVHVHPRLGLRIEASPLRLLEDAHELDAVPRAAIAAAA